MVDNSAGEALSAREDYGALLCYIGRYVPGGIIPKLPLFGLVNDRGEPVTDPLYAHISFWDAFLILRRGNPEGKGFINAVAAADGSWLRAGLFSTLEDEAFCYRRLEDRSLVFRYPLATNDG